MTRSERARRSRILTQRRAADQEGLLSPEEIERLLANAKHTIAHARAEFARLPRPDLDDVPPGEESG